METKIYFETGSIEENKKIQQRLFELGYLWRTDTTPEVQFLEESVLGLVINPNEKHITSTGIEIDSLKIHRKDVTYIKGDLDKLFNSDLYSKNTEAILDHLQKIHAKKHLPGIIHIQ